MNEELKIQMVWFPKQDKLPEQPDIGPEYNLREMTLEDRPGWLKLMASSGFFLDPDREARAMFKQYWSEDGRWHAVIHRSSGRISGAVFSQAEDTALYPNATQLFYIAVLPKDRGKALAQAMTVSQMLRAASEAKDNVYVETDDFRLPSIVNTLRLGFRPCLYHPGMTRRWEVICKEIGWDFKPHEWPTKGGQGTN